MNDPNNINIHNDPYSRYDIKYSYGIIPTVLKALLFVLLFYAVQWIVVLAVEFPIAFDLAAQGITDKDELNRLVIERIAPYSNYLSALSGFLTIISVFLILACRKHNPFKELSFNKVKISTVIICLFTGITLNFSCNVLFMFMPQQWLESYTEASQNLDTGSLFSYILGGVIFAPLTEEIIFRGLVMKRSAKCMPAALASLLAAVVFGICHGDLVWAIYAGSLGFILGLLFAKFDSIIPCIIVHFSFNSVSAVQRVVMELPAIENMNETQELLFNGIFTILCFAMLAISVALVTWLLTSERLLIKKSHKEAQYQ